MNKIAVSTYLPIITLNVNGLNALIKRYTVADWIKKTHIYAANKRVISNIKTHTD